MTSTIEKILLLIVDFFKALKKEKYEIVSRILLSTVVDKRQTNEWPNWTKLGFKIDGNYLIAVDPKSHILFFGSKTQPLGSLPKEIQQAICVELGYSAGSYLGEYINHVVLLRKNKSTICVVKKSMYRFTCTNSNAYQQTWGLREELGNAFYSFDLKA